MQHQNHQSKAMDGLLPLQNSNKQHIKTGRRKSLQEFHHFLLSSTNIIHQFPQFREEVLLLERTRIQKIGNQPPKSHSRVGKCFNYGPLAKIQYFNPETIDPKQDPRQEINLFVRQQQKGNQQTVTNIFKK